MENVIDSQEIFRGFLDKANEVRKDTPRVNGVLRHLNLIKRQDEKQDEKFGEFLSWYFKDSIVDNWDFLSDPIPDGQYSSATSFFVSHDSRDLLGLFMKLGKLIVPKGLLVMIDYDMNWIRSLPGHSDSQREEIFEAYFNLENEQKVLGSLGFSICYDLHTEYSRRNHTDAAKRAGFEGIFVRSEPLEKPKIFLYIGERK